MSGLNSNTPLGGWKKLFVAVIMLTVFTGFRILVPLFSENLGLIRDCLEITKQLISPDEVKSQIEALIARNRKIKEKSQDIIKAIPTGGESS